MKTLSATELAARLDAAFWKPIASPKEFAAFCAEARAKQYRAVSVTGSRVALETIANAALLTVEGDLDDISGPGQTRAALDLCSGIPGHRKRHLAVDGVGHYGIFSGQRWRELVYPQVREFIAAAD